MSSHAALKDADAKGEVQLGIEYTAAGHEVGYVAECVMPLSLVLSRHHERLNSAYRKGIAAPIKDFSNPLTVISKQTRYRAALRHDIAYTKMISVEWR